MPKHPSVPQGGRSLARRAPCDATLKLAPGTSAWRSAAVRSLSGPILTMEPDRGMNVFALAPRLMVNLA
jgi:hypothetical protein